MQLDFTVNQEILQSNSNNRSREIVGCHVSCFYFAERGLQDLTMIWYQQELEWNIICQCPHMSFSSGVM